MSGRSLFLSHTKADKDLARQVFHYLNQQGIRCWIDEAEIQPGQSIRAVLADAIEGVHFVGVLVSRSSVTAPWVTEELRLLDGAQLKGRPVNVLGLLADDVKELPEFIAGKLYFDMRVAMVPELRRLADYLIGRRRDLPVPRQAKFANHIMTAKYLEDEEVGPRGCWERDSSHDRPRAGGCGRDCAYMEVQGDQVFRWPRNVRDEGGGRR